VKQLTLFKDETTQPVASGHGIFFPCPIAREMPIGERRCNHIKNCAECKRLIEVLDKEVGYKK